jgi:hypothetical protein
MINKEGKKSYVGETFIKEYVKCSKCKRALLKKNFAKHAKTHQSEDKAERLVKLMNRKAKDVGSKLGKLDKPIFFTKYTSVYKLDTNGSWWVCYFKDIDFTNSKASFSKFTRFGHYGYSHYTKNKRRGVGRNIEIIKNLICQKFSIFVPGDEGYDNVYSTVEGR